MATNRQLGFVNATPLIAGSRSRLQNHLPEARFQRPQLPCGDDPPREVAVWRKSVLSCYSSLSTTFGSSRDARHAGSQLATTATAVIVAITKAIVTVSVGCTPNSRDAISRFTASAPARPMVTPNAVT